jgi:hypothetical protein
MRAEGNEKTQGAKSVEILFERFHLQRPPFNQQP